MYVSPTFLLQLATHPRNVFANKYPRVSPPQRRNSTARAYCRSIRSRSMRLMASLPRDYEFRLFFCTMCGNEKNLDFIFGAKLIFLAYDG
jgi:hypothetical protein